MKRTAKIVAVALVALACAGIAVWSFTRPVVVGAVSVRPGDVTLTFTETGSYEYSRLFAVYPLVAGEILELGVAEGDAVSAGEVIALVSASDYEHQIEQLRSSIAGYQGQIANLRLAEEQERGSLNTTLQGLEGQLAALDAEIARNRDAVDSLETQLMLQERIVNTNRGTVNAARDFLRDMRDVGEDYEISQARVAYNTAQSTLAQSQLVLEQLRAGEVPEALYEGQRAAILAQMDAVGDMIAGSYTGGMAQYYNAQIAAANLSIAQMQERAGQAALAAPVSGVIASLPAADQNLLSPQAPAAWIGGDALVEVWVPVREIDGVALGDAVELILDRRLGSEIWGGTVVEIAGEAEPRLSALGVEERKVRVLVRPAAGHALQIGWEMDVRFSPYTFPDVLLVPKTAVFPLDGSDAVWVIADGQVEQRAVQKGVETRDGYVIDEGLAPGEQVVADADDGALRPGRRVSADGA